LDKEQPVVDKEVPITEKDSHRSRDGNPDDCAHTANWRAFWIDDLVHGQEWSVILANILII